MVAVRWDRSSTPLLSLPNSWVGERRVRTPCLAPPTLREQDTAAKPAAAWQTQQAASLEARGAGVKFGQLLNPAIPWALDLVTLHHTALHATVLTTLDSHGRARLQETSWTLVYTHCSSFSAGAHQQSAGKNKQRLGPRLLKRSN